MPSETDVSAQERPELPDAVVRAQLERILASEVFSRSQQLRRFLSFVVEQSLGGQGHSLKEAVLAHELYGKRTDFDGGTDPVVRVDARRLRDKLREYYEGRSEPVVISLPKGSYVPVFEANSVSHTDTAIPVVPPEAQQTPWVPNLRRARVAIGALAAVAAVVAAALTWRAVLRPVSAPAQLLPLASYPGGEEPPALSPDGNLVAFAWSGRADAGATDIYVKAVESEALRRLTDTPSSETSPAWSPDGHSVAFVRDGHGVFTMSQLGGSERQVSASGTHVAWAGDSKSVLIRDREGSSGPFGIHQVFLDTLERRRLTQAPVGAGDYRFEVSPDGSTLAFIRYEKVGIADVYIVPMGGGEPRRLSNWSATIWGLSWTPDGQEIVYDVNEPPASSAVANLREQRHSCSRIADCRHRGGGPESVDLEANGRTAGAPFVSDDCSRHRPSPDGSRHAPGERHPRVAALFEFDSHRGFGPILARRQPDCVRVAPFRSHRSVGR